MEYVAIPLKKGMEFELSPECFNYTPQLCDLIRPMGNQWGFCFLIDNFEPKACVLGIKYNRRNWFQKIFNKKTIKSVQIRIL